MTEQSDESGTTNFTGRKLEAMLNGMDTIDEMPPDLRACVHEYGLEIVEACLTAGVTKPAMIRQLARRILAGPRSTWQATGSRRVGANSPVQSKLDWLLIQVGVGITSAGFIRFLADHNLAIVPISFTDDHPAVLASMATVSSHDQRVTKARKHALRLKAAIKAASLSLWKLPPKDDGSTRS